MNELLLLKGNPSRRRKSRRPRTAAQRAATKRMLAANRARMEHNPKRRRKARKSSAVASAPAIRRRRRSVSRVTRRARRHSSGGASRNMMGLLKTGAIMGGGAVAADIGFGFVIKTLGASVPQLASPINADGGTNYMYFAAKGAFIYALGKYGGRVTRHAPMMAAGAGAVMLYQLIRGMLPQDGSIPLGYFNPGRIVTGGNLGRIIRNPGDNTGRNTIPQTMGRIMSIPAGENKGAIASATIRNLSGMARR